MSVNLVVAVTDNNWFEYLRHRPSLTEVNFWGPSAKTHFRALEPGELILFKLRSPYNSIAGGGIFTHEAFMSCRMAWDVFGEANGAASFDELRSIIDGNREANTVEQKDFEIRCLILSQPFFLPEDKWISPPKSWSRHTQRYKKYSTKQSDGLGLWEAVSNNLGIIDLDGEKPAERFDKPRLIQPRLGQRAFRHVVIDAYGRRCAVTRERTIPALDAAHIRPYSEGGEHEVSNGLLLRRDIHSLFDSGYVTVTPNLRFEVSKKIREEFKNGRDYYSLHGNKVHVPEKSLFIPKRLALEWHNENRFLG